MEVNDINTDNDPSLLQKKVESISKTKDDEDLKEVCKEFESIFLNIMFKEMKKTIPDNGFIEKSTGTEMFEDMHIEELSKEISSGEQSVGIAKMLYEQFKNGYISW
ncbi:rod-binding protein [Schnuerera sp. xch1]|uniref:rod-binding protein n=1 Tax=Schnuerera sp. xch1 TaxID=2874283 RepID=UPI001CBE7E34|nr:rod-binding protein [Schnuerera sp. xch1]MBZ2174807.1 rod-binding protein [Schnuerera sp. xch1]